MTETAEKVDLSKALIDEMEQFVSEFYHLADYWDRNSGVIASVNLNKVRSIRAALARAKEQQSLSIIERVST